MLDIPNSILIFFSQIMQHVLCDVALIYFCLFIFYLTHTSTETQIQDLSFRKAYSLLLELDPVLIIILLMTDHISHHLR